MDIQSSIAIQSRKIWLCHPQQYDIHHRYSSIYVLIENFPYALRHVFVLGGVGEGNTGHKNILQYDAGADRWEEVGSMQVARSYHAIAVTDTANLPCDCQAQLPGYIQISSK